MQGAGSYDAFSYVLIVCAWCQQYISWQRVQTSTSAPDQPWYLRPLLCPSVERDRAQKAVSYTLNTIPTSARQTWVP